MPTKITIGTPNPLHQVRPTYTTRIKTVEANIVTALTHLIDAKLLEISQIVQANHESYELGEMFYYIALYPDMDEHTSAQHNPLLAYKLATDPDISYLHQAMQKNEWVHFRTAI